MKKIILPALALAVMGLMACVNKDKSDGSNQPTPSGKDPDEGKTYQLVWSDEFDGEGLPNSLWWTMETGGSGWGNNELQYYTARQENASVSGGYLTITARKEEYSGMHYTSTRLITANKKTFTYGKIEVCAKLPRGKGTWPAIWMLGQNIGSAGWPDCGEIDIMEHVGYDQGRVHASVHTKDHNHKMGTQITAQKTVADCSDAFHKYSIEWTKDKIHFFIDDVRYLTYTPSQMTEGKWPFNKPQFILLNLAVGGDWGGAQGIDDTIFPQSMVVDYVRVYQRK